jgi:photosystem II stability/assembly factor-like uncharacterized protein
VRPIAAAIAVAIVLASLPSPGHASPMEGAADAQTADPIAGALAGLPLRGIGPALMGGRIADIAIDPRDESLWWVAVGSGGVWKSSNAGVTWTPVFDEQPSYSIGALALDPNRPDTVWVGTGENVSGRHVGRGDGVYRSLDGGASWERMGLPRSEHIGRILVDPRDGDVVYVAAEGPLWSAGGERGLYKTTDGGATWTRVLHVDEDTGVTDVAMDPRDPDVLLAASYQRRRSVWSFLGGGPGSGIHKSTDGGATWRRITRGLPDGADKDRGGSDLGKIGLAISPARPDVVYATIEAAEAAEEEAQGFYRSTDGGESWERRSGYVSGGTGPHYYQEIVASPHDVDTVYQMDVFLHVTRDGGASFEVLGTGREKHSDNHALWIDPDDPEHLIAGTDASLYETFDEGATWRQTPNLPVSQFYKVSLDDGEPFYSILGGAQDLGTLLGPARTRSAEGIRNPDWSVPLGADGYDCAFDPERPELAYLQIQVGRLHRLDRESRELLDIQPVPSPGEPAERWNWDAPLEVSPHDPARLWFGSQRLWRSDDRGDSWTPVSGDLTRDRNRYELEMMGRVWSVDALWDMDAMSQYATLTAISESPLLEDAEGLVYTGSDDGLIHVREMSEDGGATWRTVDELPGVPPLSFVNDLEASRHDADTVFAVLDAHKEGLYRPLVLESRDRGRTWRSIAGDLPETTLVWDLEQDHVDPDLLFAGTEDGLYVSWDRGARWRKLAGGAPTIPFRDLEIQRRDDDLVGATFGRGFYVLDDYRALREIAGGALEREAWLFSVRDAWWYVPFVPLQAKGKPALGSTDFAAPNPPFGAVFTYWLAEDRKTAEEERRARDEELQAQDEDTPFPGWERLAEEALEEEPKVLLTVRDADGRPVRRIEAPADRGLHRAAWDLRLPPPDPVRLEQPGFRPPWADDPQGPLAPPGVYTVEMALVSAAGVEPLGEAQSFTVKPVPDPSLTPADYAAIAEFQGETRDLLRRAQGAAQELGRLDERLAHLRAAVAETPGAKPTVYERLDRLEASAAEIAATLTGDPIRRRWYAPTPPSVVGRLAQIAGGHWDTRQAPTATQRASQEVAREQLERLTADLERLLEVDLPAFEAELEAAGAPWTPGRRLGDDTAPR